MAAMRTATPHLHLRLDDAAREVVGDEPVDLHARGSWGRVHDDGVGRRVGELPASRP
jgi:hypothetical protein